jgi:glycosyl transferase family 4
MGGNSEPNHRKSGGTALTVIRAGETGLDRQQPGTALGSEGRRILMFAKLFPPCNCWPTASERALGLARGLSGLGWTPVVITRQLPPGGCACGALPRDVTEPGEDVEVIRVPARKWPLGLPIPKIFERLADFVRASPDDWAYQALKAARQYRGGLDLVWTSTAPIASIRLGRLLRRKLHVPWVAELRDSVWRSSVMAAPPSGLKGWLLRRRVSMLVRPLREAAAVIHVTPEEAQADTALIQQPPKVVPSAFDERAWSKIHVSIARRRESADALTVLFAGTAYPDRVGYSVFFDGVRRYARSSGGAVRPIRVEYMGKTFEPFRAEAARSGVSGILIDRGVVSLERSREAMLDADVLLLVTAPDGYAGSPGGKLYEYLAACRPVLAVPGTDEFVADVLRRTGHGVCAPDADAVFAALEQLASGSLAVPSWPSAGLQSFTWSARSLLLAEIFDLVIAPSNEGRANDSLVAQVSRREESYS